MTRTRAALVSAIAVWGAGCTLLLPLDQLSGGDADGGGVEASGEATTTDTGADAPGASEGSTGDADASGAAVDAGDAADVSARDAPAQADGGPVSCANAGVLLCEDFENGLDSTKWPDDNPLNGAVAIDPTMAHRGTHSLRATAFAIAADAGAQNINSEIGHYFAVPSPVYVRAFVYFPAPQPAMTESFESALQAHAPWLGLQLEVDVDVYAMTEWASTPNQTAHSTQSPASSAWNCIEWEVTQPTGGSGVGQMTVWVDGGAIGGLTLPSVPMSDLGELAFGISFFQVSAQPQYELWIDDIFVDTSPIGCAK
jgi:hypothetical protein